MGAGSAPPFVIVGRITRPHGTKGEFFVRSLTDHPDATFVPGVELRIADPGGERPDELFPPIRIAASRPHQQGFLVSFEGVEDRSQANFLRDRDLLRPFSEVAPPEEGELFHHQVVGMSVVTVDGRELGVVREIHELEPADLLEVSDGRSEYLIPFRSEVVVETDVEAGRIVVDPPEGLLDL